ncbi:hypothetical protein CLOP_g7124 [Closterium sp. NIES-67]|nr:hypothetical protein CLOP_g7124 [Closterium sp. NIES-67]
MPHNVGLDEMAFTSMMALHRHPKERQDEHPPQRQHPQRPRAAAAAAATAAAAAAAEAAAAAAAAESATTTVEAETPGKGDAARTGRGYHQSQQTPQRGQPTGGE